MSPTESVCAPKGADNRPEPAILFQKYFKAGTRTYAAQVKQAANGNHFLVLTEGRREQTDGDVRKSYLLVFSERFAEFFGLLRDAAQFINSNPVPLEVRQRQAAWKARREQAGGEANTEHGNAPRGRREGPPQSKVRGSGRAPRQP